MTTVKYPAPRRRLRRSSAPDDGATEAQAALNRITGRTGFLDAFDVETTSYYDVFGEEPGDR